MVGFPNGQRQRGLDPWLTAYLPFLADAEMPPAGVTGLLQQPIGELPAAANLGSLGWQQASGPSLLRPERGLLRLVGDTSRDQDEPADVGGNRSYGASLTPLIVGSAGDITLRSWPSLLEGAGELAGLSSAVEGGLLGGPPGWLGLAAGGLLGTGLLLGQARLAANANKDPALSAAEAFQDMERSRQRLEQRLNGRWPPKPGVDQPRPGLDLPKPLLPVLPGFPGTPIGPVEKPPVSPPPLGPIDTGKPRAENIPPTLKGPNPRPLPPTDDPAVNTWIKAGSKTPWADAYPGIADWLQENGIVYESKGNAQTQKEVDIIIEKMIKAFDKWKVGWEHTNGGTGRKEKDYADEDTGHLGSGRPDASFRIKGVDEKGHDDEFLDVSHTSMNKDNVTLLAREQRAKANLKRLFQQRGQNRPLYTFPKSRWFKSMADWESAVDKIVEDLMYGKFGPPPE